MFKEAAPRRIRERYQIGERPVVIVRRHRGSLHCNGRREAGFPMVEDKAAGADGLTADRRYGGGAWRDGQAPGNGARIVILRWVMAEGNRGRHRDKIIGIVLGLMVAVVGAVTLYYLTHTVQRDARIAGLPIPVQTSSASVQVLHETIGASGRIEPSMPVTMTAKVVSRVLKVPVDLGAVVRPGELLVELDPRLLEAALATAKVNYDHARRQLARMESLQRKQFAAAVDVEKARTDQAAAQGDLIRAQIDLANTRILSPVPAVVLDRTINPGEFTKLDQDLITLGVLDPVMMVAQVSEDKIGAVYLGMKGAVGTDAFPGLTFTGAVAKIDSRVNDATRAFGVYIQLANHNLKLYKGVTGYARLETSKMALAVPSTAVMNPVGDQATVFVVSKDNRAHLREVRRGMIVGGMTELLGGVEEGEQVVAVGQFNLHDNDRVSANHYGPWNQ